MYRFLFFLDFSRFVFYLLLNTPLLREAGKTVLFKLNEFCQASVAFMLLNMICLGVGFSGAEVSQLVILS